MMYSILLATEVLGNDMVKKLDITGKKFNRLLVMEYAGINKYGASLKKWQ